MTVSINTALSGQVDESNTTSTPLNASQSFTGQWVDVSAYPSVVVAIYADQAGDAIIQFSPNASNVDSQINIGFSANTNEVHRITITRKFFRLVINNTSLSNQTYLRAQVLLGSQTQLSSLLNAVVQKDSDALIVRPMDFNLLCAQNLYESLSTTIKDGINSTIATGTVPEDLWSVGGVYSGFPTGAVEAAECVVAGADTGTVYYSYLASSTSTEYTQGSVAVAGAGTYPLGHNIYRCNFMYFVGSTTNVGTITIRNTPTTANVFVRIEAGEGQSYCAAYTVPAGSSIFFDRAQGNVRGNTAAVTADGFFWFRPLGESPRLRFPFSLQYGGLWFDDHDYLVRIPQQVDIMPRITTVSATVAVQFTYRFSRVAS